MVDDGDRVAGLVTIELVGGVLADAQPRPSAGPPARRAQPAGEPVIAAASVVIPDFGGGAAASCERANGLFCFDWVRHNWSGVLWPALVQHVELTAIALVIGFAIALTLALAAYRLRWLERPFSIGSVVLYTIPSLALFQILVPVSGLSRTTAEIALVSYTLLILFRNILTGLREVPAEVGRPRRGDGHDRAAVARRASSSRSPSRRSWPVCASPR